MADAWSHSGLGLAHFTLVHLIPTFPMRDSRSDRSDLREPMSPSYSVVIPSKNRQELLRNCVDSVAHQEPAPRQIIIVDDGSDSPVSVHQFSGHQIIPKVLRNPFSQGQGAARNIGARECDSEVVVFVDDDNVMTPGCGPRLASRTRGGVCAVAVQMIRGPDPGGWSADWTWITSSPSPAALARYLGVMSLRPPESTIARVTHPSNVYAIKKCDFERVGGFSLGFFSRYLEDVELGFRLRKAGIRCEVVGDAITHHTVHGGQTPLPSALAWKARGNLTQKYLTLWEMLPSLILSIVLAGRSDFEQGVRLGGSSGANRSDTFVGWFLRGFFERASP